MSGFLKSVGKVFKKIVQSPIFKVVAIAAAVYFTGGLALTAMGGEAAAFAATLPGISSAAGALGIGEIAGAAAANVGLTAAEIGATGDAIFATGAMEAAGMGAEAAGMGAGALEAVAGEGGSLAGTIADSYGAGLGAANEAASGIANAGIEAGGTAANAVDMPDVTSPLHDAGAPASSVTGSPTTPSLGSPQVGPDAQSAFNAAPTPNDSPLKPTDWGMGDKGLGTVATAGDQGTLSAAQIAKLSPDQSTWASIKSWYNGLDPLEKKMLGEGLSQAGKGALNALSVKSQQDFQMALENQRRGDVTRKGQTFDLTSAYKPVGIINAGTIPGG